MRVKAALYQQFDADVSRDVPAEGFGGWGEAHVEISPERTAIVVMHAWDTGTPAEYPGWHRAVEYLRRADEIGRTVLPPLLAAARAKSFPVMHVVGGGDYYTSLPGFRLARDAAGAEPPAPVRIPSDPTWETLQRLRRERVSVGPHNETDVARGFARLDFMPGARPRDDEGIAESSHQLHALCSARGINHLIYAGFAINWCLLVSPGGMVDMERRGFLCSAFRQAVTAVENRESARTESAKELALWRVSLGFGLVFDVDDFIEALRRG